MVRRGWRGRLLFEDLRMNGDKEAVRGR
jgi:hypothetical protein